MLLFSINGDRCTRCGACVADCPSRIIVIERDAVPSIPPDREENCIRCQHCLAVCPTGALSILGRDPDRSAPLTGAFPAPEQLECLIKGRRSVRRYRDENLDPDLLRHLLEVAWHAPTGVNARQVLFTVVDDRAKMAALRGEVMGSLGRLVLEEALPEKFRFFERIVKVWEEKGVDVIFRGAPHLLIASAPQDLPTPLPDCLIALSHFDLYAQACGVGTVWNGYAGWALGTLAPGIRRRLGIPEEHLFGYCLSFGPPAVTYARTVEHGPALINRP